MSLYLSKAGQAEIIRSLQKDNQFIDEIHLDLSELFRRFDNRLWLKYDGTLKILLQIFYYSFHALHGIQTLGEEYTGIIQIDSNYRTLPNRLSQVICVSLEYSGEFVTKHVLKKFKCDIQQSTSITPEAKRFFISLTDTIVELIPILKAFHRSFFYITGGKYQISKRLMGINYVLVRYWLKQDHSVAGYKVLGVITLCQALISLSIFLRKRFSAKSKTHLKIKNLQAVPRTSLSGRICILCMDTRVHASSIPCGHIFCWSCILEWLSQRDECPICREATKASQTILLLNYQSV